MLFSVVLLCVKPSSSTDAISEKDLAQLFEPPFPVKQIYIFQKEPLIKAFIDFDRPEIAREVLDKFNERQLPVGFVRLYPSKKSRVKDLRKYLPKQQSFEETSPIFVSNLKNSDTYLHGKDLTSVKKTDQYNVSSLVDRTFKPASVNLHEKPLDLDDNQISNMKLLIHPTFPSTNFNKEFDACLISNDNFQPSKAQKLDFNSSLQNKSQEFGFGYNCLKIENVGSDIVTARMLFNLLCCFGNVTKLILRPKEGLAFAQFENSDEIDRAIVYLDNQQLFGHSLKLFLLKDFLLEKLPKKFTQPPEALTIKGSGQDFRYKGPLAIKFNPPTNTLHFTNLSDHCTPMVLYEIVKSIWEPKRIVTLGKKSSNNTQMMLVEFASSGKALEVLAVVHNKIIDHKSVKVSFSQTKIH